MYKHRKSILVSLGAIVACVGFLLVMQTLGASAQPSQPDGNSPGTATAETTWTIDSFAEFAEGATTNVQLIYPGAATLDWLWWPDVRVNTAAPQSRFAPRTTWAISSSGGLTQTLWLVAFADERQADHSPDIYVAGSLSGGRTWLPDVHVDDGCNPDVPPYHDCLHNNPDIAVRSKDNSVWVVWRHEVVGGADLGNVNYAASYDLGATWSEIGNVANAAGPQISPRLSTDGATLYAIWEDENADAGDVAISRYNPEGMVTWRPSFKVSDDTGRKEQRTPAVTADTLGNVYAVWVDTRTDDDGQIYFSRWISGTTWAAESWSAAVRISDPSTDWAENPDIRAASDGSLYAAWMERVPTGPATYDFQIVVARSTDQGSHWTPTVVNRLFSASATNAFYGAPSLGVTLADRIYVTWLHSPDSQAATANVLVANSFDAGRRWSTPRQLNSESKVDVDSQPSLAVALSGQAVVAWQDFRLGASTHIFAADYPGDRYAPRGDYSAITTTVGTVAWGKINWTTFVPTNTGLVFATRVQTATTSGWTAWITHTVAGETLAHPPGTAIQVRASFTSTGAATPVVSTVRITYQPLDHLYLPLMRRE